MTVLIVDDESLGLLRLRNLLKPFRELTIVGEARNASEARCKILNMRPELVFLDIELGDATGFDVIELVNKAGVRPKFILTTGYKHYAIEGIRHQVVDYLIKPIDLSELKAALDRITRQPDEEERLSDMAGNGNLTSRERTILSGMLAGKSSKEIALDLCLSTHTVDTFRRRILKKTGAKNTVDLVHRFATSS